MEPNDMMINGQDFSIFVAQAVRIFWGTKERQLSKSGDSSNRGAVVGGKQLDGFIDLIKKVAIKSGIREEFIITDKNYLPGYFRSSKNWDMLIISPSGKLIAAVELKSQVGSYGNNFNNRTEEAIGSAVDLWTAFREGHFPTNLLHGLDGKLSFAERPVRNNNPYFPVRPEFEGASYLDRYRILCQKLILERHYSCASALWTSDANTFGDLASDISISRFLKSLSNHLSSVSDEFK